MVQKSSNLWSRNEVFPKRIELKPIKIFDKPAGFKYLISRLKFIRNKQRWTEHTKGKQ